MIPHERSLVEKYKDRPFVILGINTDKIDDKLKSNLASQQVTWRSFCEGSTGGPIARRFNVSAYPTVYLLDAQHVIRFLDPSEESLDEAIETLVNEAESAPAVTPAKKPKEVR